MSGWKTSYVWSVNPWVTQHNSGLCFLVILYLNNANGKILLKYATSLIPHYFCVFGPNLLLFLSPESRDERLMDPFGFSELNMPHLMPYKKKKKKEIAIPTFTNMWLKAKLCPLKGFKNKCVWVLWPFYTEEKKCWWQWIFQFFIKSTRLKLPLPFLRLTALL